jgi:hypothetical protein
MISAVIAILPILLLSTQIGNSPRPTLDEILQREAEYCRRLELAALDFVCIEDITEKIDQSKDINLVKWSSPRDRPLTSVKRTFLYDFQFIRKGGSIKETRTLLKLNGRDMEVKDAKLETGNFIYKNAVLAPVGIFGDKWHESFNYKITGDATVGGRSCLIISAVPKGTQPEIDFLSGRAFIDKATLDILKIEWSEQKIGNYEAFVKRGERYKMKPRISVTSEFEAEKNGIRFPTRHLIEEAYFGAAGMDSPGKFVRSRTTVLYRDFKFFTVSVERDSSY